MIVQTLVTILFLLSSPFIIITNVLIVSSYFRFKRLQTPSNALIVSLAASDFGFGFSLPVVVIYQILKNKDDDYTRHDDIDQYGPSSNLSTIEQLSSIDQQNCPLRPCAILILFSISSIFSIGAIAFDRLLSVGQPLRYNHYVTSNYIQRFLFVTWFLSVCIGFTPFLDWFDPSPVWAPTQNFERSIQYICWLGLLIYIPNLVCAVLSYTYIYIVARGHSRAIYMVEVSLNHGDICHLTDTSIHHHRYGLTLTFLLTIFIVSWSPLFLSTILTHFAQIEILHVDGWRAGIIIPTLFGPLLNPLLYGFRSSEIRICVIRIVDTVLTRLTGRPRTIDIFHSYQPKGELTSCASNVRLLAVSPNETTVHCCPTPTPTHDGRNHLQILLCDQTSL